jgi:thiol:disulfide interchange protein DsbD
MREIISYKIVLFILLIVTFNISISYCQDIDIPIEDTFPKLTAKVLFAQDSVQVGSETGFAVIIDIKKGYHINSHTPTFDYLISTVVEFEKIEGIIVKNIVYPDATLKSFEFSNKPLAVYKGKIKIFGTLKISLSITQGNYVMRGKVNYQACNDKQCFRPAEASFKVELKVVSLNESVRKINSEIFAAALPQFADKMSALPEETIKVSEEKNEISEWINRKGYLITFILIFFMGILLNLTPCVFPVIPLTVGYFISQSEEKTVKIFFLSLFYVLGIAMMYSFLGVIAGVTGTLFGSALSNPFVLMFISLVIVILALSLFNLYELKPPVFLIKKAGSRRGFFGAFFMGLLVGIVAAPCIGPVILSLLIFVGEQRNPVLGFWMFFILAVGMGLPYIFLGIFTSKLKVLPKAGDWMVGVRKIFGLILLWLALYFIKPLFHHSLQVYKALEVLLLVGAGVYLIDIDKSGKNLKLFYYSKKLIGIIAFIYVIYIVVTSRSVIKVDWKPYSEGIYNEAIHNHQKIIIDFYAIWCAPCMKLEEETFSNPEVVNELSKYVLLKIDLTSRNQPESEKKLMGELGVKGVPWIAFIDSDGKERKELRITEFVKPREFLEHLEGF